MAQTLHAVEQNTYSPSDHDRGILLDLVGALSKRGGDTSEQPVIVTSDGTRHELTDDLADLLVNVAESLARGQAVTVVPRHRLLTTQEAADLLNVSRPTLVKILEAGEIPFEMRGRHRRVRLDDVLDYQRRTRAHRSEVLHEMQRQAEDDGLYDLLDRVPPATR